MQTIRESKNLKKCSKCLVEFSTTEFYSKGNRLDSWCKSCKKSERKSTYVSQKEVQAFDGLVQIGNIVYESEVNRLMEMNERLEKMIHKCQAKSQR